jgi:hypothetical protein
MSRMQTASLYPTRGWMRTLEGEAEIAEVDEGPRAKIVYGAPQGFLPFSRLQADSFLNQPAQTLHRDMHAARKPA